MKQALAPLWSMDYGLWTICDISANSYMSLQDWVKKYSAG